MPVTTTTRVVTTDSRFADESIALGLVFLAGFRRRWLGYSKPL